jgi:hypothetical protein
MISTQTTDLSSQSAAVAAARRRTALPAGARSNASAAKEPHDEQHDDHDDQDGDDAHAALTLSVAVGKESCRVRDSASTSNVCAGTYVPRQLRTHR